MRGQVKLTGQLFLDSSFQEGRKSRRTLKNDEGACDLDGRKRKPRNEKALNNQGSNEQNVAEA